MHFEIERSFIEQYRKIKPSWDLLGYFTYKRTYARPGEEWVDTCQRVVEGVYSIQKKHCNTLCLPWNEDKAQSSSQEMFSRMFSFKFLPAGRGLWGMGTPALEKVGGAMLNNCAFISTENLSESTFADPFCFLMDMSMLGVGVGADTKGAMGVTIQSPSVDSQEIYHIEDSREGWVACLRKTLNAYVQRGKLAGVVSYERIRESGAPLKTFGGVSSGAQPLMDLMASVHELLQSRIGEKLRSVDITDIFNMIGKCVVAGGIRRTAEIMIGDANDQEFLDLKENQEKLMEYRWASNNSIFAKVGMDYGPIVERIVKGSDVGFVWLDNARDFGRMDGMEDFVDYRVMGTNPCGEQSLENYELCNLVETFPANHEAVWDYMRTLKFAYLYAKTVTLIPTHNPQTNAVMMRNRRIGCSMSGIVQAMNKFGRRTFLEMANKGYTTIQELDRKYSEWLCIPRSIKTTSIKPSGTVSLLCGATSGIHYPHSEYYIRNVRVNDKSPLVEIARKGGYKVEKDSYADNTFVISFPIHEKFFDKSKEQITIWEQFSNAAAMQKYWADNQVSITVTFKKEEESQLQTCLEVFEDQLKAVSLLPLRADDQYVQAPYIKITKEQYTQLMANIKEVSLTEVGHEVDDLFCSSETCTVLEKG